MYTSILMSVGIRVAYATRDSIMPRTHADNTDRSFAYDLELIHPDLVLTVPQTMNDVRRLFEESPSIRLKSFLYVNNQAKPRLGCKHSWPETGDQCTLKYRLFGGNLKALIVGAGHLSPETYSFAKRKLSVRSIVQHFACAESCACILVDSDGSSLGSCGFPLWGTLVRLIDWEEGGYFVTDKPNPRGEILLGGEHVSDGYFADAFSTANTFLEEGGKTWCLTGDIGEILPDGSVRVVDRKRDLIRLPSGLTVAPTWVEAAIKKCVLVDNAFVYGTSQHDYIIAIIRPKEAAVKEMAQALGLQEESFPFLCYEEQIRDRVLQQVSDQCRSVGLQEHQIPRQIRLSSHTWASKVGNLVTDFFSVRHASHRHQLREFFKNDISMMYD